VSIPRRNAVVVETHLLVQTQSLFGDRFFDPFGILPRGPNSRNLAGFEGGFFVLCLDPVTYTGFQPVPAALVVKKH